MTISALRGMVASYFPEMGSPSDITAVITGHTSLCRLSYAPAWRRAILKKRRENALVLAGGLVRDHARLKEHEKSQAKTHRKQTNTKTDRF